MGDASDQEYSIEEVRNLGQTVPWNVVLPAGRPKSRVGDVLTAQNPDIFAGIDPQTYASANASEQKEIVRRVTQAYLDADAFPVYYFSEQSAQDEVRECIDISQQQVLGAHKRVAHSWGTQYFVPSSSPRAGIDLCNWMFPNLFDARAVTGRSLRETFQDPTELSRAIQGMLNGGKAPKELTLTALQKRGYFPRNFRPMTARAIYETYLPNGGTVLDPSSGFGGRLLGALTASSELRYIGCDPNVETIYNLDRLGKLIESVTGRTDSYELHCRGSQNLELVPNSVDFAFTSPPYFNLEIYNDSESDTATHATSERPSQSVEEFATRDSWLEGFAHPTNENVRKALKPGAYFLVNLTDYEADGETVEIVDGWVEQAEKAGLVLVDMHYLATKARPGKLQQHRKQTKFLDGRPNAELEPILVFKKF